MGEPSTARDVDTDGRGEEREEGHRRGESNIVKSQPDLQPKMYRIFDFCEFVKSDILHNNMML